ncbi:hypothetical protein [Streptomyces sp. NPDC055400]
MEPSAKINRPAPDRRPAPVRPSQLTLLALPVLPMSKYELLVLGNHEAGAAEECIWTAADDFCGGAVKFMHLQ